MKVLVTGATGFLGQNLVNRLLKDGHKLRCLVRSTSDIRGLRGRSGLELFEGDLTDRRSLAGIASDIDAVCHLAGIMGHVGTIAAGKREWERFRLVNVQGTLNIAETCLGENIQTFVYISSTAAMGILNVSMVTESTNVHPETPYQVTKYEGERVVLSLWRDHGLPAVVLRPSVFYGYGMVGDLAKLVKFAHKGVLFKIGSGESLSPLCHVQDVVSAIVLAFERGKAGETYIITGPRSYSMNELIREVVEQLGARPLTVRIPVPVAYVIAFLAEFISRVTGIAPLITVTSVKSIVTDRVYSIQKAHHDLGYVPSVSLQDSVQEAIMWLRDTERV